MAEPLQEKHKIWDSYWHDSRMLSTVAESSPDAEVALEASWRDFFSDVPNGASVLDLACGNGHLALMAARFAQDTSKTFKLHGIDAAAIDPHKYVPKEELLKAVEFKGQIPIEALPYETGMFDAVVSQYGIEFADSRAIAEAARVTRRGGKFCAVTFAANSPPVVQSASKMRQSQFLLNSTKLFDMATAVAQGLHNIEKNANEENAGRDSKRYLEKFSKEVETTMSKFKHGDSEIVEAVITSLQHVFVIRKSTEIATQLNMIALMKKRIAAHVARLDAITRAALGDNAVLGFKRKLADAGMMNVSAHAMETPGGIIGHRIHATRM